MLNNSQIEKKWQHYWQENNTFKAHNHSDKPKYYYLVEFPYPSGSGLHVGHGRSYTALDVMARKKRMQGFNVLFPIGWDAFGAPAEQYAIKNHIHPKDAVVENIQVFKTQIEELGISFDWSREFSTTDPEYYKWTQWQFLQFFKNGLAYKAKKAINWCPACKTGLSNEDAAGGACERCGTKVVQKEKAQWMLKMSAYAEELLSGLDDTDFQERIKQAQINWIGKSTGAEVDFKISDSDEKLRVFTTRPDTLYGVTFMVVAPEHPLLEKLKEGIKNYNQIIEYKHKANEKTEFERIELVKEKTGVKIEGIKAINPVTNTQIEIWVADYVMMNYGTGAIMAVPAHDERDYEFATKFNIPIIPVIEQVTGIPRDNEQHKKIIVAVIYDEINNKYLTLNWQDKGGRLFIGGSIKDNESTIECAQREVKEKTGYCNIELIRESFPINHHYYAYNKNKAYCVEMTGLLFKLIDPTKLELVLDEDEKNNFILEWVTKETIVKEVIDEGHKALFENLINPQSYTGEGIMINSDILNGLTNKNAAIEKMINHLENNKLGIRKTNYRLQDWIFSRQRFWGEPIPLVCCEKCGWIPVPESTLPVTLPDVANYEPTDDGESPLANIKEWVNTTCPKCGAKAVRETDTMPNWAGSSWYWLRYMDAHNNKEFVSKEAMKYWGMVDYYNGGMEHATRHLLYARFWHRFLYDQGLVPTKEPFKKRVAHGMILGADGQKMSKSKGNVVNPNDMVREYGADALRCYEMFIGDYEKEAIWSENGLKGCRRFLDRVIKIADILSNNEGYTKGLETKINQTIKKVSEDIDNMKYNTAVSALMILLNDMEDIDNITKLDYRIFLHLLNPIAPHITEELNEMYAPGSTLCESLWPIYDPNKLEADSFEMVVQVCGKVRGKITISSTTSESEMEALAKQIDNVAKYIESKEIVKIITIPKKLVNIVVK